MTIELEKLKKLAKKLIEAPDRSHLLIKNAPEKIYFIVVALITLVQLLKRFGFAEIAVSDYGVKEGYLKLALLGRREGPAFALLPRKACKRDKIRRRASGTHKIFAQGGKTRGKARRERREA